MNTMTDERRDPRFEKDTSMFLELGASSGDKNNSDVVISQSLDLSNQGAQIVLDRNIPEGRVIPLCLDIKGNKPIFVVARVVWRRCDPESGDYHIGFMLLNSRGTDFDRWQLAVAGLFPS